MSSISALTGAFLLCVLYLVVMSTSFDFQIISNTAVPGISLVDAQNENAYHYLLEELDMDVMDDGYARLYNDRVGDFINDAEHAHFLTALV